MDRGAWPATDHGVTKNQTLLYNKAHTTVLQLPISKLEVRLLLKAKERKASYRKVFKYIWSIFQSLGSTNIT